MAWKPFRFGFRGVVICFSVLLYSLGGCGTNPNDSGPTAGAPSSTSTPNNSSAAAKRAESAATGSASLNMQDPQSCVAEFLEAIRQGDDEKILRLYTQKARAQAATLGEHFAPKGSDTAKFSVGQVEYLDDNSARVAATWSDLDAAGQPHSDEALWMVRREPEGWRVAAMAVKVFDGEDYLFLDFEDLQKTKRMLEEYHREHLRRLQSAQAETPDSPTVR